MNEKKTRNLVNDLLLDELFQTRKKSKKNCFLKHYSHKKKLIKNK